MHGVVGAPFMKSVRDEVPGGGLLIGAEGIAQVVVVGEVLSGIELIAGTPFGRTLHDKVPGAGMLVGAQRVDQIAVGGDVLQAVE